MTTTFEVLHAFSNSLTDGSIHEDRAEIEIGHPGSYNRVYQQHAITVRGQLEGLPIVVGYQRYYFSSIKAGQPPTNENVLEVYTPAPALKMEGVIRRPKLLDKLMRGMSRTRVRGAHSLYSEYLVEATEGEGVVFEDALSDALLQLLRKSECIEMGLQLGGGFNGIYPIAAGRNVQMLTWLAQAQILVARLCR